jgi:hypothetical protein
VVVNILGGVWENMICFVISPGFLPVSTGLSIVSV